MTALYFYSFWVLMIGGICFPESSYAKEAHVKKHSSIQFQDKVRKLEEQPEGYRVFFETHAGVYYLNKTHKNFDQVEQILQTGLSAGTLIHIESHPTTLEILKASSS